MSASGVDHPGEAYPGTALPAPGGKGLALKGRGHRLAARAALGIVLGVVVFLLLGGVPSARAQFRYADVHAFGFTNQMGGAPVARLIEGGDGLLYGTTRTGGIANRGTVFRVAKTGAGYTVLHHFQGPPNDGAEPGGALLEGSDGFLYGTTRAGGPNDAGTVFKLNKSGSGYQVLLRFEWLTGGAPHAGLIEGSDGWLYGTTRDGGAGGGGTVFRLSKTGGGYSVVFVFLGPDGSHPEAPLLEMLDGFLYGTTWAGGAGNYGTVFRMSRDGADHAVLHSFLSWPASDGSHPQAPVIEGADGGLYGTTLTGGTTNRGTIFRLDPDGGNYTVTHHFLGSPDDGGHPTAGVAIGWDGALYGTTTNGAAFGLGGVYRINPDGAGFVLRRSFAGTNGAGSQPLAEVLQARDGRLYGTTYAGGDEGLGIVYGLNRDGGGYAALWSFRRTGGDGEQPQAAVIEASDGVLYGTTFAGGLGRQGTLFRVRRDGAAYQILRHFPVTGGDGASPAAAPLEASDGLLYGTTMSGGAFQAGMVYRVGKDGGNYAVLRSFETPGNDGRQPQAALFEASDGRLYGTTLAGGLRNKGTIFTIRRDGGGYQVLHSFLSLPGDGFLPLAALRAGTNGLLYGTTFAGGNYGRGTVFRLDHAATNYTIVRHFQGAPGDGEGPAGPVLTGSDGRLYGTTQHGGSANVGAVFRLNADGTGQTLLWSFAGDGTQGVQPKAGLIETDAGTLYGTTSAGGTGGQGTVFRLNKDGTGFGVVWSFQGYPGAGGEPWGELVEGQDGALYGTTRLGGPADFGTVFQLSTPLVLYQPLRSGNRFSFQFNARSNAVYTPQYRNRLTDPTWISLPSITGVEGPVTVTDSNATSTSRYYRVQAR